MNGITLCAGSQEAGEVHYFFKQEKLRANMREGRAYREDPGGGGDVEVVTGVGTLHLLGRDCQIPRLPLNSTVL